MKAGPLHYRTAYCTGGTSKSLWPADACGKDSRGSDTVRLPMGQASPDSQYVSGKA